jgi:hypothetical protein
VHTTWVHFEYTSSLAIDYNAGSTALELTRRRDNKSERVARIMYWDASGEFTLEMFTDELPLVIIEELIAEAKREIRLG